MFGNKKNIIPPRPRLPDPEHMFEDLESAAVDDVAFKIISKDDIPVENPSDMNNSDIYRKVKMYLNIKQQLKCLENALRKKKQQLQTDNDEIKRLADDIRKQAQAALTT